MTYTKTKIKWLAVLLAMFVAATVLVVFAAKPVTAKADKYVTTASGNVAMTGTTVTGFSAEYLASSDYLDASYIHLVIPDMATEIAAEAFRGDNKIVKVTLPASVTSIGSEAFRECNRLVEVCDNTALNLASKEKGSPDHGYIAYGALNIYGTSGEATLSTDADGYVTCVENRAGIATHDKYLVGYVGDDTALTLPAGTYNIYRYAFWRNSAITSVDASAATVVEIGEYAFFECANLASVTLAEGLKNIGLSAFQGSSKLTSCTMPASLEKIGAQAFGSCDKLAGTLAFGSKLQEIGTSAFYGCSSVSAVTFADPEVGNEGLSIARSAFQGCSATAFSVLRLPAKVKLALASFVETALQFVYLPADGAYSTEAGSTLFFNVGTKVICPDYATYSTCVAATDSIGKHSDNMTYIVKLSFNGNDGQTVTPVLRLAGQSYDHIPTVSGEWAEQATDLPTQEGYSRSVWYAEETFATKIAKADINTTLQSAVAAHTDAVAYYARFVAKSDVTVAPRTDLVYKRDTSYVASGLVVTADTRVNIKFADSATLFAKNAATYNLAVTLKTAVIDYGDWATPIALSATIERKAIVLDEAYLVWKGVADSDAFTLIDGSLYVYTVDGGGDYYSLTPLTGSALTGKTLASVLPVTNAIARERGGATTVSLVPADTFSNDVRVVYTAMKLNDTDIADGVRTSSTAGRHVATAQISANANYIFKQSELTLSGVTVRVSADGTHAIVDKEWYFVAIENRLFVAGGTDAWTISGWVYGQATTLPTAPVLERGTDADKARILFSLVKDDNDTEKRRSFVGIPYDKFADYINGSMPAGEYQLGVQVPQVNAGGMVYFPYLETYTFTVSPVPFDEAWATDAAAKLVDVAYQSVKNGDTYAMQLYGKQGVSDKVVNLKVWSDFASTPFNPTRTGVWSESTYDSLYSDRFYITYNLDRMGTDTYFTYSQLVTRTDLIRPSSPDTYTVYYQISANNYQSLTDTASDDKRLHKFEVVVYELLALPDVSGLTYNGTALKLSDSPLYTVTFDENDTYINAGRHTVTLVAVDGDHYKWKNADNSLTASYNFTYNVERATNTTSQNLYMAGWQFGTYDAEVNLPTWSTVFFDNSADFYTYVLKAADGTQYAMSQFANAPVGNYTLIATAKGYEEGKSATSSYNWTACTETLQLRIDKTHNEWFVLPSVSDWQYRGYDMDTHLVLGTARFNLINFAVTTDAEGKVPVLGLEGFTVGADGRVSETVATLLNGLPAGKYYLVATVTATDNYEGLSPDPTPFNVNKAENVWKITPTVTTWVYSRYTLSDNPMTAVPTFGSEIDVTVKIVGSVDGEVYFEGKNGSSEMAAAMVKLPVGSYVLTASLAETDNYRVLNSEPVLFSVFKKPGLPVWATVTIAVGALLVAAAIIFILWKKGVFQLLTDKVLLAIRTKATIDATIAAIRANKIREKSEQSIAAAKARDKAAELRRARAEKQSRPIDERIADAEAKEELLAAQHTRASKRLERAKANTAKLKGRAGIVDGELEEGSEDASMDTED